MKLSSQYTNGEITITWRPRLCNHSGICIRMLPKVYHPRDNPWIKMRNATTEELINQVDKCPTGALSYRVNPDYEPE